MSQPEMKIGLGGTKLWTLNRQYHREGGPAIERLNGKKEWWLNDQQYSPEDYIIELERRGLKDSIVNTLFNIG